MPHTIEMARAWAAYNKIRQMLQQQQALPKKQVANLLGALYLAWGFFLVFSYPFFNHQRVPCQNSIPREIHRDLHLGEYTGMKYR